MSMQHGKVIIQEAETLADNDVSYHVLYVKKNSTYLTFKNCFSSIFTSVVQYVKEVPKRRMVITQCTCGDCCCGVRCTSMSMVSSCQPVPLQLCCPQYSTTDASSLTTSTMSLAALTMKVAANFDAVCIIRFCRL